MMVFMVQSFHTNHYGMFRYLGFSVVALYALVTQPHLILGPGRNQQETICDRTAISTLQISISTIL